MIYYKAIIEKDLTYKRALNKAKKMNCGIIEINGNDDLHIILDDIYYVVKTNKTINIIEQPMKKSKNNWAIVMPTNRLFDMLKK